MKKKYWEIYEFFDSLAREIIGFFNKKHCFLKGFPKSQKLKDFLVRFETFLNKSFQNYVTQFYKIFLTECKVKWKIWKSISPECLSYKIFLVKRINLFQLSNIKGKSITSTRKWKTWKNHWSNNFIILR